MSEPTDPPASEELFVDDARRYRLDARIATGGMGEVWRGTDTVLDREVAVKLLKNEYADNATFRSRFETEARHAAALHHPGVAAVYDFGEAPRDDQSPELRPYLVMELVDGQPLSALLQPGRPLDPVVTRDLLAQAAAALGAAHAAGIVHRDVKPANLLVTPDRTVKITDFGIARAADGMALTETGQVMGTPQYLSPEQAQGGTATPASDVYSLGVVAFECLAGRRPYVADSAVATALAHLRDPVPDLPAEVPADLAAVVRRAMAKSPEDRFADGDAFAAALRDPASSAAAAAAVPEEPPTERTHVLAGGAAAGAAGAAGLAAADPATAATPVTPATGTTPPARRTPWGWILLALLVVAAIVLVAVLASGDDDTPTDRPDEPTTSQDTRDPEPTRSEEPTEDPTTAEPSQTEEPSQEPSQEPTTQEPTETPTEEPTTEEPTETPTEEPSETPTESQATQESPDPSTTIRPSPTGSSRPSPGDEETA